ncbi:ORFL155W [Human betaherpesvirus 5]|nr:ORFL155W [Human betaherpesvirus 5]QHX40488.1 ORFL155W [Human betaherpesvirus 5]
MTYVDDTRHQPSRETRSLFVSPRNTGSAERDRVPTKAKNTHVVT